jgi:hypothetical protein
VALNINREDLSLSSHYTASGRKVILVVGCAVAGSEAVAQHVLKYLAGQPDLQLPRVAAIEAKVKALQKKVGYSGNYREWIAKACHFDGLSARPEPVEEVEAPV